MGSAAIYVKEILLLRNLKHATLLLCMNTEIYQEKKWLPAQNSWLPSYRSWFAYTTAGYLHTTADYLQSTASYRQLCVCFLVIYCTLVIWFGSTILINILFHKK